MCTCTHMNTNMHTHKLQKIPFFRTPCQVFYMTIVNTSPLFNRKGHTHSVSNKRHRGKTTGALPFAPSDPGGRRTWVSTRQRN